MANRVTVRVSAKTASPARLHAVPVTAPVLLLPFGGIALVKMVATIWPKPELRAKN